MSNRQRFYEDVDEVLDRELWEKLAERAFDEEEAQLAAERYAEEEALWKSILTGEEE